MKFTRLIALLRPLRPRAPARALSGAHGLLRALQSGQRVPWHGASCTCCGALSSSSAAATAPAPSAAVAAPSRGLQSAASAGSPAAPFDTAFEFSASQLRFGVGATAEVGWDAARLGAGLGRSPRVFIVADGGVAALRGPHAPLEVVLASLARAGLRAPDVHVYTAVQVEPTDVSVRAAAAAAAAVAPDVYIAVGGGSAMDTCKVANLYTSFPDADFLDFVNAPVGRGLPVPGPVKPLIAIPTTAGTGSETTGVAIFDYTPLRAKTGIASRLLKPSLGIVDPRNTQTMPAEVAVAAGFDVLCHALESYTAIPFDRRGPPPARPELRPAYQGSNPISDAWATQALRLLARSFVASVKDRGNEAANADVTLAATVAGIGFGNAGVHLCHGMSYAISGLNTSYWHPGYPSAGGAGVRPAGGAHFRPAPKPLVPHGISVVLSAPAVFTFTAATSPGRHMHAARLLAGDAAAPAAPACEQPYAAGTGAAAAAKRDGVSGADAGAALAEQLRRYMSVLRVPDGLAAVGFTSADVPALVEATLPQRRVLDLAPASTHADDLTALFKRSFTVY